jgi:hypothetical protein
MQPPERSMEISKHDNYIKRSINHIGHSSEDINAYLNLNEFEPSFTSI